MEGVNLKRLLSMYFFQKSVIKKPSCNKKKKKGGGGLTSVTTVKLLHNCGGTLNRMSEHRLCSSVAILGLAVTLFVPN